jgi:DNA gyrase inhibitor GyrI
MSQNVGMWLVVDGQRKTEDIDIRVLSTVGMEKTMDNFRATLMHFSISNDVLPTGKAYKNVAQMMNDVTPYDFARENTFVELLKLRNVINVW